MADERMSRRVISPTLGAGSSPKYTFEVMQRRLQMAEDETKKLVEQLAEYGFNRDRADDAEGAKPGMIEPVKPFKATGMVSPQMDILQRNYEQIVTRVCRAESTIQSLKLAMCSLEAEKNLAAVNKEPDEVTLPKDTYENEIKKLKKDSQRYKKELEICEKGRKEAQDMVKRLASELDKSSQTAEQNRLKMEELKLSKQKLTKKINEVSVLVSIHFLALSTASTVQSRFAPQQKPLWILSLFNHAWSEKNVCYQYFIIHINNL